MAAGLIHQSSGTNLVSAADKDTKKSTNQDLPKNQHNRITQNSVPIRISGRAFRAIVKKVKDLNLTKTETRYYVEVRRQLLEHFENCNGCKRGFIDNTFRYGNTTKIQRSPCPTCLTTGVKLPDVIADDIIDELDPETYERIISGYQRMRKKFGNSKQFLSLGTASLIASPNVGNIANTISELPIAPIERDRLEALGVKHAKATRSTNCKIYGHLNKPQSNKISIYMQNRLNDMRVYKALINKQDKTRADQNKIRRIANRSNPNKVERTLNNFTRNVKPSSGKCQDKTKLQIVKKVVVKKDGKKKVRFIVDKRFKSADLRTGKVYRISK